jgi:hypothetical protein
MQGIAASQTSSQISFWGLLGLTACNLMPEKPSINPDIIDIDKT